MSIIEFVSYRIKRTCSHASQDIFDGNDGKKIFFLNTYQLAFSLDENVDDDVHTSKCKCIHEKKK